MPPRPAVAARRGPRTEAVDCGLCGLARNRPGDGRLLLCPFCDQVRDID